MCSGGITMIRALLAAKEQKMSTQKPQSDDKTTPPASGDSPALDPETVKDLEPKEGGDGVRGGSYRVTQIKCGRSG